MTRAALLRAGAAYGKLGFFSDSVSDFSQAIRCDPSSYLSFFNRAMAYTRISRYAEAVADLKRVLEIEPTYVRAQQLLLKVEPHAPAGTAATLAPPLSLRVPLSSASSLGSIGSSSRASTPSQSPSPASVVDTEDQSALGLGDLGIVEDEFDISLLARLFDEEAPDVASPKPPAASLASRKAASSKRSSPTAASTAKKPRKRAAGGGAGGGGLDSLDSMLDNDHVLTSSSRDWSLDVPAGWFSLD